MVIACLRNRRKRENITYYLFVKSEDYYKLQYVVCYGHNSKRAWILLHETQHTR